MIWLMVFWSGLLLFGGLCEMSASVRTEGLLVVCDVCEQHYMFPVKHTRDGMVFDPARDVSGWQWIGVVAEAVPDVKTAPIVAKLACPACVEARTMRKPRRFRAGNEAAVRAGHSTYAEDEWCWAGDARVCHIAKGDE